MNPLSAFPINTQMSTNITIDIRINIRREPRTIPAISKFEPDFKIIKRNTNI